MRGEPSLVPVAWGPSLLPLNGQAGVCIHPCAALPDQHGLSLPTCKPHVLETPNAQGKQTSCLENNHTETATEPRIISGSSYQKALFFQTVRSFLIWESIFIGLRLICHQLLVEQTLLA